MKISTVKLLKYIAVVCVLVLFLEAIYIIYLVRDKSIYFDGINSIINVGEEFVAVGSNNNNDKYFEKAKITKYNDDKEKLFEKIYNKGYNGVFFDVIAKFFKFIKVFKCCLTVSNLFEHFTKSLCTDTAWSTLTARFINCEVKEELSDVNHTVVFVHYDKTA